MPGEIIVRLEFPDVELAPNTHIHWRAKRPFIKAYRQAAEVAARNVRIRFGLVEPLRIPVEALAIFVLQDRHRRDGDNLQTSIKSGIDGLVDARLLKDDSLGKLRLVSDYRLCRPGEKPHVEIHLTQAPLVEPRLV